MTILKVNIPILPETLHAKVSGPSLHGNGPCKCVETILWKHFTCLKEKEKVTSYKTKKSPPLEGPKYRFSV